MRHSGAAAIVVAAPIESVWALVTDVTRVGEWSGECRGCAWLGAPEVVVGTRFRGRNRRGLLLWRRVNEVVLVDVDREFAWRTVPTGPYPDSVEWHVQLESVDEGVHVRLSYQIRSMPRLMEWLVDLVVPAHRDRDGDLALDLTRLKRVVEG